MKVSLIVVGEDVCINSMTKPLIVTAGVMNLDAKSRLSCRSYYDGQCVDTIMSFDGDSLLHKLLKRVRSPYRCACSKER